ncbi:MAG: 50S ribosomal protein L10 [Flavobacteriaceae bacterium]|nr:MAG: 50S ribosomal protein L10 [Flavobacteriaceae bacterium]
MTREEKGQAIQELVEVLDQSNVIYLADIAGLNAGTTSDLRRACFKNNITIKVVKNKLLKKAMEACSDKDFLDLPQTLVGNTTLLLGEKANGPAKIIQEFRRKSEKPELKGAFISGEVYLGDKELDALAALKSKEEMIGEIIGLLQSPAKRILSALLNNAEKSGDAPKEEAAQSTEEPAEASE